MLKSLNTLILATVTGIVCITIAGSMLALHLQTTAVTRNLQEAKAEAILGAVTNTIANAYQHTRQQSSTTLEQRKTELRHLVAIAHATLAGYQRQAGNGRYTPEEARELARDSLKQMRWSDDVGYFWLNDTTLPIPRMIMHPTLPQLDGRILDDPNFACALGRDINLFRAAVLTVTGGDNGYIDYLWPKPNPDGSLTPRQPKISFVRLFEPWDWVIGSGVYIDDIEAEVDRRITETLEQLRSSFNDLKIGENGYMFVFSGAMEMLIHPQLQGRDVAGLRNPDTGSPLLQDIMAAAHTPGETLEYRWTKPGRSHHRLWDKKLYVDYFEPLDWYICVSYYQDEIDKPVRSLSRKLAQLGALFLAGALILAYLLGKALGIPLRKLVEAAEIIDDQGLQAARIPIGGFSETRELGQVLSRALKTIGDNKEILRRSEQKYRYLVEYSLDGIFILRNQTIVFANSRMLELTGLGMAELAGISPTDLFAEDHGEAPFLPDFKNPPGHGDNPSQHPVRLRHRDGGTALVTLNTVAVEWENSEALLVFARDITEQKKLETALFQAQKMEAIGTLAGGMAHDFNNLLMGIQGRVSLLSSGGQANPRQLEHCQAIENYIRSATNLTSQILGISRGGRYHPRPLDINQLVSETATMYGRTRKEVQLETELHAREAVVEADKHQLEQVLLNLYVNASQAMPGGGTLHLETALARLDRQQASAHQLPAGSYVRLTVADTGEGMDEATRQRIFDPFFTTKERGRGTGLGLASAFGIIQNHGGAIFCSSEPGQGATFTIYLPLSEQPPTPEENPEERLLRGTETILLVDDERIILEVGEQMLKQLGYRVQTAANGPEALSIIREGSCRVDLAIIDMIMPGMDGETLFHRIRESLPKLPIILASGYARDRKTENLMEQGCNGFIQKPFSLAALSQLLRKILDGAAPD